MTEVQEPYNPVRELGTVKVPYAAALDRRLSDGAFRTLALYLYHEQHNLDPPDVATVAGDLNCSIRTINRYRQELAACNYITIPPQEGWIYVVQCDRFCKIGKTNNVKNRFAQIQSSMPFLLKLVHQSQHNDIVQAERHIHGAFSDKRVRGEWFDLTEEDLAWFKTL